MKGFIYCNSKVYPDDEYCALMTVYRDLLTAIKTMTVGDCIGVDELYFRDGAIFALFLNECCAEGEITFIMRVNKGFLIQYNYSTYVFTKSYNLFMNSNFASVSNAEAKSWIREKASPTRKYRNQYWNIVSTLLGKVHKETNEQINQFIERKTENIVLDLDRHPFYRLSIEEEIEFIPLEMVWRNDDIVIYCDSMPPIVLGERDEEIE